MPTNQSMPHTTAELPQLPKLISVIVSSQWVRIIRRKQTSWEKRDHTTQNSTDYCCRSMQWALLKCPTKTNQRDHRKKCQLLNQNNNNTHARTHKQANIYHYMWLEYDNKIQPASKEFARSRKMSLLANWSTKRAIYKTIRQPWNFDSGRFTQTEMLYTHCTPRRGGRGVYIAPTVTVQASCVFKRAVKPRIPALSGAQLCASRNVAKSSAS